MRGRNNGAVPPRLLRASARFTAWRRTRALGTRIPPFLWAQAVKLATAYGICRTAAVLKLDYYGLKRRVDAKTSSAVKAGASPGPAFVELDASSIAPPPSECVIELENSSGAKMRIHLKGVHAPDVVALSGNFWEVRR